MKTFAAIVSSILMLMVVTTSGAQAETDVIPSYGPIPFAQMDRDANGVVSREEFQWARDARRQQRAGQGRMMRMQSAAPDFADLDLDQDGRLDPAEWQHHMERRMPRPAAGQAVPVQ